VTPARQLHKLCGVSVLLQVIDGTTQDVEFTIEFDQLSDWINDAKSIFYQDLFEGGTKP